MKKLPNFRSAIEVKLTMVSVMEGEGTEENPYSLVHYFCRKDGTVLFKNEN